MNRRKVSFPQSIKTGMSRIADIYADIWVNVEQNSSINKLSNNNSESYASQNAAWGNDHETRIPTARR